MQAIPANIVKFLSNHHVVSIAAAEEGEVWALAVFMCLTRRMPD